MNDILYMPLPANIETDIVMLFIDKHRHDNDEKIMVVYGDSTKHAQLHIHTNSLEHASQALNDYISGNMKDIKRVYSSR